MASLLKNRRRLYLVLFALTARVWIDEVTNAVHELHDVADRVEDLAGRVEDVERTRLDSYLHARQHEHDLAVGHLAEGTVWPHPMPTSESPE